MSTRAKLKCFEIAEFTGTKSFKDENGNWKYEPVLTKRIKMQIVGSGTPENDVYAQVSGGTNIELVTNNEAAYNQFRVGGEYYMDLSAAGEAAGVGQQ